MRPLRTVFSSPPGGTAGVLWRTQVSRTGSKQPPKNSFRHFKQHRVPQADFGTIRKADRRSKLSHRPRRGRRIQTTARLFCRRCRNRNQNLRLYKTGAGSGKNLSDNADKRTLSHRLCKIVLDTNLRNKRAQHVYERLGFRRLRVNVNSWVNQLGDLQSSVDYELNRNELNCFY